MPPITRRSARRDWSGLPEGVLASIATRLVLIEDFIAFRATCTPWKTRTDFKDFNTSGSSCPKLPVLMHYKHQHVFYDSDGNMLNLPDEREFINLSKEKTRTFSIPEASGMECIASRGWLTMVEHKTGVMCLFHLLTRARIPLPNAPPKVFIPYLMCAVLSASPSDTRDYVLMIAYMEKESSRVSGRYVGFWKPGNKTWTRVDIPPVQDLYYYNGKFYGLTYCGQVCVIDDVSGSGPDPNYKSSVIAILPWGSLKPKSRLVECEGRLLIVAPFYNNQIDSQYEDALQMCEIDVIKGSYTPITSLGNSTVFIGDNQAFSIDANRFPGILVPNTIYFSDLFYRIAVPGRRPRKRRSVPVPQICWGVWLNF